MFSDNYHNRFDDRTKKFGLEFFFPSVPQHKTSHKSKKVSAMKKLAPHNKWMLSTIRLSMTSSEIICLVCTLFYGFMS